MNPVLFHFWILILTLGILQAYSAFRSHFSGKEQLQARVHSLQHSVEQEKMRRALAEFHLRDFRENVATLIPNNKKLNYQARNLASVIGAPDPEKLQIESAATLFNKARSNFRERKFETSNKLFKELIENHPFSGYLVESYFMLAEGHYRIGEESESLEVIDTMIRLFPENDLTGFAMVLMADLMVQMDRPDDAEAILETVKQNFNNPVLRKQVQISLRDIKL